MRKGFTLLETVMATSLMALIVVAAMGSWILFLHKSNRVNNQSMLDVDARMVVERFRAEMRNAARETIIFFPENSEPYQAIGFALAEDTDNDGLMDMDAQGSNILWRQTVVYHVWDQDDPPQMRRTLFSNRNNDAGYEAHYNQIASVYSTGSGTGASLSGERAKTSIMFENLFSGKLWHAESVFDGYAPKPNTSDREVFGSLSLGPGEHTLDLTIAGQHPQATGHNIKLDQLSVGVSGWPLEAERRVTSSANAIPLFIGPNQAGAAYGLNSIMSGIDDNISINLYNDAIEEAEFIGKGRNVSMSNTVVRFDKEFPPSGFEQGAYVTKLDGQFATMWQGGIQSGDGERSEYYYPTNCTIRIPIMAPWVVADGYGPVFRLYKSLHNGNLAILNPVFAVVPTPEDINQVPSVDIDPGDQIPLEFYQNGTKKASWISCANQSYVELRPEESIKTEEQSTLMLTFQIKISNYKDDRLTVFDMKHPGIPGCWVIAGGDASTIHQADWSSDSRIIETNKLPTLEVIAVNYADSGAYISHVYDTRSNANAFKTIEWEADVPSGAELKMYARSGDWLSNDGFDIADATTWEALNPVANGGGMGSGRYLQFRAEMQAQPFSQLPEMTGTMNGPYRCDTPRLHHVLIKWDGETKYVDIMANLLKSPECGMFKVEMNGKPLIRGVRMEIEIFKDIRTMGGQTERIRSSMMAEVEPRNTKKKK